MILTRKSVRAATLLQKLKPLLRISSIMSNIKKVVPPAKKPKKKKAKAIVHSPVSKHWKSIISIAAKERKGAPVGAGADQKSVSSVASMLVDPKQVYLFRITAPLTLTSTGGVVSGFIAWDPSSSTEWTALSSLFMQCRLHQAHLTFLPGSQVVGSGSVSTQMLGPMYMGCDFSNSYSAPTPAQVAALASCRVYSLNTYAVSDSHRFSSPVRPNSLWAPVATPIGFDDCGCFGQFVFSQDGLNVSSSLPAFTGILELIVEMRARS